MVLAHETKRVLSERPKTKVSRTKLKACNELKVRRAAQITRTYFISLIFRFANF